MIKCTKLCSRASSTYRSEDVVCSQPRYQVGRERSRNRVEHELGKHGLECSLAGSPCTAAAASGRRGSTRAGR